MIWLGYENRYVRADAVTLTKPLTSSTMGKSLRELVSTAPPTSKGFMRTTVKQLIVSRYEEIKNSLLILKWFSRLLVFLVSSYF